MKEITAPINLEHGDNTHNSEHRELRDNDTPRINDNTTIGDTPVSGLSDVYDSAFRSFDVSADSAKDSSQEVRGTESASAIEKNADGTVLDKDTGKVYDSLDAWKKSMETLAKRYDSTSEFYENKAKKEWARFKNADANGNSEAEKWKHYSDSQMYYEKAKEFKDKAEKTWTKLDSVTSE